MGENKMKTNTIKIFGILAAVLMVTVAFTPLSTFATQLSKDESLDSDNDYSSPESKENTQSPPRRLVSRRPPCVS